MGDVRRLPHHDDRAAERAVFLSEATDWLFARGHAADLVLAVMLVELAWLTRRRHWSARAAILRLAPGALMVVALRCALTGAGWPWIALALAASLPFHLADLAVELAEGRRRDDP